MEREYKVEEVHIKNIEFKFDSKINVIRRYDDLENFALDKYTRKSFEFINSYYDESIFCAKDNTSRKEKGFSADVKEIYTWLLC